MFEAANSIVTGEAACEYGKLYQGSSYFCRVRWGGGRHTSAVFVGAGIGDNKYRSKE